MSEAGPSQGVPSPHQSYRAVGLERAERAFLAATARGRLHHAWLLTGAEGVGKASFAYRAARRLLGAAPASGYGALGADPDDPVSRLVAARAHPDLLVLQRDLDEGGRRKNIPVEEARELPEFFSKTPAIAPWRVAIIDAVDDLWGAGANAVLKTLEEPPGRGALFLISHRPGALLPTLRSRCRALRFHPPPVEESMSWLREKPGLDDADAEKLLTMAGGAPGRAWRLAGGAVMAADQAARELLAALLNPDPARMLNLADSLRGPAGVERFELLFARLADLVHRSASARAGAGEGEAGALAAWGQAFEMLNQIPRQADAINLDRADVFFTTLDRLAAIARRDVPC